MKKKLLMLVLAMSMLTVLFTGCSNNNPEASGGSETDSKFVVLDESLATEEYGIAFRLEDTGLRDAVDAALMYLKAEGTVATISEKWFGKDITMIVSDASALDNIEVEQRTFILGLDDSFPPMGYRDDSNNIVGFDIDLAQAVCDVFGWTLELQPIDWSAKEMELETGNIDCIWNGMTLTEERQASMSCSSPYLSNEQVLVVLEGSGYNALGDLSGKKLALQSGSSAEEALDSAADFKESLAEVNTYSNNLECFMDLEQGGVDAVLVDSIVANWYIATGNAG